MTPTRVVLVTAPDRRVAVDLCHSLLEERLVACANLLPGVTSLYRWEGELREDSECLLIFKTSEDAEVTLLERIAELHPYDVPEILVLPVLSGHRPYLDWVATETRRTENPPESHERTNEG